MKAVLRYLMLLAVCLLPVTFLLEIKERFPISVGIVLAVTAAYWISYAILEKKRKKQENQETSL